MTATGAELEQPAHLIAIQSACSRIPPLWPLQNFVAVNQFLGFSDMPFRDAVSLLNRVLPGGLFGDSTSLMPTVADWLDSGSSHQWAAFITDEISKFCASYFDVGQSLWAFPWKDLPLYEAWKEMAAIDANPEVYGLADFRAFVRQLPDSAEACVQNCLETLAVPPSMASEFLLRELVTVFGWSALIQHRDAAVLPQLLAIRLAYDAALLPMGLEEHAQDRRGFELALCAPNRRCDEGTTNADARVAAQQDLEQAFRLQLIDKLKTARAVSKDGRKKLQAVFCIDVRSEVLRRALETQSPDIETIGFAGFFGMPLEVAGTDRCPVLLKPSCTVESAQATTFMQRAGAFWKAVSKSAVSCFSSVEVGGNWFAFELLRNTFKRKPGKPELPGLTWQVPLEQRVSLAADALQNMSVDVAQLASVVLFCGHGSLTENNPFASSLDCGACGGHKGDANAFFAAHLLNDPEVREGLRERGICIPSDTVFTSGMHITSTEDVFLHEADSVPREIVAWLKAASSQALVWRNNGTHSDFQKRAADWSEVRPEWGLAGNAAFIAAKRSRTYGVNLEGRVFLHDYDSVLDTDGSVLNMILNAPVIVASWINLQYFGSVVNNQIFGSGNKTLHNVVGGFGVWEGNGGDLRTGLPLQSLHDGEKWVHEPLRLQVFVDAPRARIDEVLRSSPHLADLVNHEWIYLVAMEE